MRKHRKPQAPPATIEDRLALIAADPKKRLRVRVVSPPASSSPKPTLYKITPTDEYQCKSKMVHLYFEDREGHPRVHSIVNQSKYRGWGTEMVVALMRGYPGEKEWEANNGVASEGVIFWKKCQERFGIKLAGWDPQEPAIIKDPKPKSLRSLDRLVRWRRIQRYFGWRP